MPEERCESCRGQAEVIAALERERDLLWAQLNEAMLEVRKYNPAGYERWLQQHKTRS